MVARRRVVGMERYIEAVDFCRDARPSDTTMCEGLMRKERGERRIPWGKWCDERYLNFANTELILVSIEPIVKLTIPRLSGRMG